MTKRLQAPVAPRLTPREAEILEQILRGGLGDKQIADAIGISRSGVRRHLERMQVKFGAHSKLELLVAWLKVRP